MLQIDIDKGFFLRSCTSRLPLLSLLFPLISPFIKNKKHAYNLLKNVKNRWNIGVFCWKWEVTQDGKNKEEKLRVDERESVKRQKTHT